MLSGQPKSLILKRNQTCISRIANSRLHCSLSRLQLQHRLQVLNVVNLGTSLIYLIRLLLVAVFLTCITSEIPCSDTPPRVNFASIFFFSCSFKTFYITISGYPRGSSVAKWCPDLFYGVLQHVSVYSDFVYLSHAQCPRDGLLFYRWIPLRLNDVYLGCHR